MLKRDPTGTGKLRQQFASAVRQRWRLAEVQVRHGVVEQDMFGLRRDLPRTVPPGSAAISFSSWVRAVLSQALGDGRWARSYIQRAYEMGARGPSSRSLELLVASHSSETTGVLEAVVQRAARAFNSSLVRRRSPSQAMAEVSGVLRKVGLLRSLLGAHVAVVSAHASGTLDRMEQAGVRRVAVVPEHVPRRLATDAARRTPQVRDPRSGQFRPYQERPSETQVSRAFRRERRLAELHQVSVLTAGDDRVCSICEDIAEEGPYDIDQARGLIPAHPNCRCAFVEAA